MTELNLNSIEVQRAVEEHGLKPGKNGDAAVKPGSRQKLPKVAEPDAAPEVKKKKFTVELNASQEARLIREASNRQVSASDYLQEIVGEKLGKGIGASFISGPRIDGKPLKKITAPTNSFGRDV